MGWDGSYLRNDQYIRPFHKLDLLKFEIHCLTLPQSDKTNNLKCPQKKESTSISTKRNQLRCKTKTVLLFELAVDYNVNNNNVMNELSTEKKNN